MKYTAVTLMVLSLLMPAFGKDAESNVPNSNAPCSGESKAHAHQYSDYRLAAVEITKTNSCGFGYVNLEEQTVGPDNYLYYTDNFEVVKLTRDVAHPNSYRATRSAKDDIRKGFRAVVSYCSVCKAVFNMKPLEDARIAAR